MAKCDNFSNRIGKFHALDGKLWNKQRGKYIVFEFLLKIEEILDE